MTIDLESLHKVLKDETRRRILRFLNEKSAATYTELMEETGVASTGTLNYHLKVLGDLLTKNEAGQYVLTDKGKDASRLMLDFPERENQENVKKKWWNRFWVVAVAIQLLMLASFVALYVLRFIDVYRLGQGMFAVALSMVFTYFYYRMIRPPPPNQQKAEPPRTTKDIAVIGRSLPEVKAEVRRWVEAERITVEIERDDFLRGRLGIPSGLGLTAPKYFEVSLKQEQNSVTAHTEGWISMFDVSEKSFTSKVFATGNIPRRKGWKVINQLWTRLEAFSRAR